MEKSCGKPPRAFAPGCRAMFPSAPAPAPAMAPPSPPPPALSSRLSRHRLPRGRRRARRRPPAGLCGQRRDRAPVTAPPSAAVFRHKVPPAYKKWPQYLRLQKIPLHPQHKAFYFQVKPRCQHTPGTGVHLTELLSPAQVQL